MSTHYTCGGCTNTWTGLAQCHCSVCHETFGGVSNFDRHRLNGECRHPSVIGLTIGARGVWSEPFSWQRDNANDPMTHVMAAFRNHLNIVTTTSIYTDPGSFKTTIAPAEQPTHDDVADLSELGSDEYNPWLRHGHEDI